ncbi:MAG: Chemotaxis phosphatase CheX [Verrucomicrobiota bacterium]
MMPTTPHPDLGRIGGEALRHVLSSLLSFRATEETPVQNTAEAEDESLILATVDLIGEHCSGAVRLQIPEAFARLALGVLVGAEDTDSLTRAQIDDLCGELGNMVAGRVAADLAGEGHSFTLGTPGVVRGAGWLLKEDRTTHHAPGATAWSCQKHRILIEVSCHFQPL